MFVYHESLTDAAAVSVLSTALNPIEVSLMHMFFTASDFLPTKWSTADEKAVFGNTLLHFMLTGFLAGRFTEKLYTRLSMCLRAHCSLRSSWLR